MNSREPSDAEIDAAFNDIVARYSRGESAGDSWAADHPLFADPDPDDRPGADDDDSPADGSRPDEPPPTEEDPDDNGPVLRGEVLDPPRDPAAHDEPSEQPLGWRVHHAPDDDELDDLDLDELPRTPLPPWRPSSPAMAALVLIVGSTVVTLLLIAQVRLPWWSGWAALVSFLAGMGLLFSRLPRTRDEDADDGAVV